MTSDSQQQLERRDGLSDFKSYDDVESFVKNED
ncbi:MAG: hypothetical protein QG656_137, partial [Candidatus Hydrogenedentes bacterium]|nr:hypothetical protein [Candidatus Hydrogenedentota bacterium]